MNAAMRNLQPSGQLQLAPGVQRKPIYLSHSRKQKMLTCGRMYQLHYEERLEEDIRPSTFVVGKAAHTAAANHLTSQAFGLSSNPETVFVTEWDQAVAKEAVQYSTGWNQQALAATGRVWMQKFVEDWAQRGWTAVIDINGIPVVERELKIRLPNGDVYLVIIDALVRTRESKVLLLDFKTPAAESMEGFAGLSDQLLGGQIVVDAHAESLGIDQVDGLVFYEFIKKKIPKTSRGEGPVIHVQDPAPRRSQEDIDAFIAEAMLVARDIREKRFAKRPMDSFNSPCQLCGFLGICRSQDYSGLHVRPKRLNEVQQGMEPSSVVREMF